MDALPFIESTSHVPGWWQLALIALPVWMLIAQIRRAGLVAGSIRALGGVIAWVIIWFFLTFLGVMIGSMADHYERATDETNDSPYSNTYEDAPANPGEYYDPNEQQ
ncbi:hypothetical protein [Corynebacterium tuberculostearicum]|uniref:hypothetical protein n=1 Tax=Corynebacterium tuberculostearicum TaxID=38304 RepID=UPI00265D076D|nr:hypothetical protein [Corynebacterium tuberculostearicum]WKE58550.1 hypothetical protein J8247_11765 [Corynebacterium tuberculostearicum]